MIDNEEYLILQIISEGLAIAGWVALWFPLNMLIFTRWEHRLDKRIYTVLMEMDLTIKSASYGY